MDARSAARVRIEGAGSDRGRLEELRAQAEHWGLFGWVQAQDDAVLCAHIEGDPPAIEQWLAGLRAGAGRAAVSGSPARPEGHEQFAIRGVPAGVFVVQEHQATAHHFDLRLEVDGVMRSWAVPKGPSLDPAVKRFAVEVEDHSLAHNAFEGLAGRGGVIIWDRGEYEQRGRVAWPEALRRGHAVFVLHGQKLTGGFALQRTRSGAKPQWLLIKRRDEHARPGSDVVAELPHSLASGVTLTALLGGDRAAG